MYDPLEGSRDSRALSKAVETKNKKQNFKRLQTSFDSKIKIKISSFGYSKT
jgi:hypothetical protein